MLQSQSNFRLSPSLERLPARKEFSTWDQDKLRKGMQFMAIEENKAMKRCSNYARLPKARPENDHPEAEQHRADVYKVIEKCGPISATEIRETLPNIEPRYIAQALHGLAVDKRIFKAPQRDKKKAGLWRIGRQVDGAMNQNPDLAKTRQAILEILEQHQPAFAEEIAALLPDVERSFVDGAIRSLSMAKLIYSLVPASQRQPRPWRINPHKKAG